MDNRFTTKEYKRSRNAYMVQCAFEYFIALLVADAFLAKLLSALGIGDNLIGIISSFVSLAFVFQLLSIFLVKAKTSTKKIVMICDTVSILFFMLVYLVPFIPVSAEVKKGLVVVSIMVAYAIKYLISSMLFKWANSHVEPSLRAVYSANKEVTSLIAGIIFTAVFGYIIDKFESLGNLNGAFLFISASILIINIGNFICLKLIKSESEEVQEEDASVLFKDVLKNTFVNKNFRNVILMESIQKFAMYFTIGFMGVYKTKELAISVFVIQLINIVSNAVRMLISKPFAIYSDKRSFAKGMELGLCFAAAAFFVNIFTTPQTWWLVIVFTVLYNVSMAGTNQNSFNIAYSYVPLSCITQAMAIKNSISGLCGFMASIIGGIVLEEIQNKHLMIFGVQIYSQQIQSAVSFVLILVAILFIHFVIAKQKVKIQ